MKLSLENLGKVLGFAGILMSSGVAVEKCNEEGIYPQRVAPNKKILDITEKVGLGVAVMGIILWHQEGNKRREKKSRE